MKQHKYANQLSAQNKLVRLAWGIVSLFLFRPTPRWALNGWRCTLLRFFGARIGVGCRIDPTARVWMPSNLKLGDYVAIAASADIYCVAPIDIGSKVAISQRAFLCTASHDISALQRPLTCAPIRIDDHAWIAAEAMILPGVRVGEGAVISARAVLRKPAGPWTIHAGNPARHVGERRLAPALPA